MFKKIILFSILLTALITGSVKAVTYYFPEQGGTGTNTKPVDSQILIGAPDGLYDVKTLTAGTNITITSTTNALTITSSGGTGGGSNWQFQGANAIRPTSTVGLIVSASSTFTGDLSVGNDIWTGGDITIPTNEYLMLCTGGRAVCNTGISWDGTQLSLDSDGDVRIYAFSESDLVVDYDTGYVGIATTTPAHPFVVNSASANAVWIDSSGLLVINSGAGIDLNNTGIINFYSDSGITPTGGIGFNEADIMHLYGVAGDINLDYHLANADTFIFPNVPTESPGTFLMATGTQKIVTSGGIISQASSTFTGYITAGGGFTGNASTADALKANGANCTNQFPLGVNASGAVENCTTITTAYMDLTTITLADFINDANFWTTTSASSYLNATTSISIDITGNAGTATALAANPTNCSAGQYPLGIDASGNVEDCTVAGAGGGSNTWDWIVSGSTMYSTSTATTIGVGTTTPRYTLDIWGDLIIGTTTAGATSNYPTLYVKSGNGWGVSLGTTTNTNLFKIGTTSDYLIVDRQGQIGINTSTPTKIFSVQGEVYISATSTSRGLIIDDGVNATATPQFGDTSNPSCLKMYDGFRGEWVYLRPSNSQTSGFVTTTAAVCNTN